MGDDQHEQQHGEHDQHGQHDATGSSTSPDEAERRRVDDLPSGTGDGTGDDTGDDPHADTSSGGAPDAPST